MKHFNKVYGLTGGIASGKSTVANILKAKGFRVIDADEIARDIMEPGRSAYIDTVSEFGLSILDENERIDRKKLSNIVFNDRSKLSRLNKISHKRIIEEIKQEVDKYAGSEIVFVDIPLLFEEQKSIEEEGLFFDGIIVVYVNPLTQLRRLVSRDGISSKEAKKIISAQMPIDDKKERADYLLDNELDLKNLEIQIEELLNSIGA